MTTEATNSLAILAGGGIPELDALRLHNGTIWRWNRPCYGITNGRPHLRIEFRSLPAGPSVVDEVANAAFCFGLLTGALREYGEISRLFPFEEAKENFLAAARHGLKAQLTWIGGPRGGHGQRYSAPALILDVLLPLAKSGLKAAGISTGDIDRYLGIIEARVGADRTGSQWAISSLAAMESEGTHDLRLRSLTAVMLKNQVSGIPVHEWEPASFSESSAASPACHVASDLMSTDLFTVHPGDAVQLAASIMVWQKIHHISVEDDNGHLVGMVSQRDVVSVKDALSVAVRDVMSTSTITVSTETPARKIVELMNHHQIDCLPVVEADRLIGIITAHDVLRLFAKLLSDPSSPDEFAGQIDALRSFVRNRAWRLQ
jgi:CBS domain-containing protein